MKTPVRTLPPMVALIFFLSLTLGLFGRQAAEQTPPPTPDTPPAEAAPAAPAAETAPSAPAADEDHQAEAEKPELRRLDVPPEEKTEVAPEADADADIEVAPTPEPTEKPHPDAKPVKPAKPAKHAHERRVHRGEPRVSILGDSTLAAGEYADAVISIGGSSTASGHVGDAVVSIAGSSTSDAEVGGGVVSIGGDTKVNGGSVGDAAVAVLGNNYVNAHVGDAVVAVLGNVELGPKADVGDVVCVGGAVKRDPAAIVRGQVSHVGIALPFIGGHFDGLHAWFRHCLLLGRPLGFGAHLGWAWAIALTLLALYVVIALLFPRGVERCAETLEQRPGMSILTAFLVTLLAPLATILLIITVVGAPAMILFLILAGFFGKAVMLAWIGRRITNRLSGALASPAFAVLVGGAILLLLYTIPFVGFLVAKLTSWLGLGVVVYTLIQGSKRNKAAARAATMPAAAAAAPSVSGVVAAPAPVPVAPTTPAPEVSAIPAASAPLASVAAPVAPSEVPASATAGTLPPPVATEPPVAPPPAAVPPLPPLPPKVAPAPIVAPAATLPRAGFWIRTGASALDAVLVGMGVNFLPHVIQPNFMLALAAYSVVLWTLKGTTVGGIVCGLKVVRLDDRPMDWATAIVRALGGFLSFFVAGFGFIWVAFDDQKQSWHDKIAGTTVVFVPKGTSLI